MHYTSLALSTLLSLTSATPLLTARQGGSSTTTVPGSGIASVHNYSQLKALEGAQANLIPSGACPMSFASLTMNHVLSISYSGPDMHYLCGTCVKLTGPAGSDYFIIVDGKTDQRGPDIDEGPVAQKVLGFESGQAPGEPGTAPAHWEEADPSNCKGFWTGEVLAPNPSVGKMAALQAAM